MIRFSTRWHKVMEAVLAGRIVFETGRIHEGRRATKSIASVPEAWRHAQALKNFKMIDEEIPKVLFTSEVCDLVNSQGDKVKKSVCALAVKGHARLRYPAMLIEMQVIPTQSRFYFIFEHSIDAHADYPFWVLAFDLIRSAKDNQDYVLLYPAIIHMQYRDYPELPEAERYRCDWKSAPHPWFDDTVPEVKAAAMAVSERIVPDVEGALSSALLMMRTRGIKTVEVAGPSFLNRQRKAKGKPQIPSVIEVSIGHVFTSEGRETREVRRSASTGKIDGRQMIHWRGAHLKTIWHGKRGNQYPVETVIEAYLVNVDPDDISFPEPPKVRVKA